MIKRILVCFIFMGHISMATDNTNNEEKRSQLPSKKVITLTKSYRPPPDLSLSNEDFSSPLKLPTGPMYWDPIRKSYYYKKIDSCLKVEDEKGNKIYLAVALVEKDSYQYAFFSTQEYLDNHTLSQTDKFKLIQKDGYVFMECYHGEKSYLSVEAVGKNSFQWAFFSTGNYLKNRTTSCDKFKLFKNKDGTFRIQCDKGEKSYLAVSKVSKGSYQYAFFGSEEYLNNGDFISSFIVNPNYLLQK